MISASPRLIDNALCGYRFAGLPRILAIAEDAEESRKGRGHGSAWCTRRRCACFWMAATMSDMSPRIAARSLPFAKAKVSGIAIVGVNDSWDRGRNAYYVEQIARCRFGRRFTP